MSDRIRNWSEDNAGLKLSDPGQLPPAFREPASYRQLEAKQVLFYRGEPTTAIFSVVFGRMKLIRYGSNGAEVPLHIVGEGERFAEAALFSEVYQCDAIADLPSQIAVYPKQTILNSFRDFPDFALDFTASLARHLQLTRTKLELRNIHSARDRTWQYLIWFAEPDQTIIVFDRPLKDIASDLGLTHESSYRTLKQLEKEGFITRQRRQIRLLDPRV